MEKRRIETSRTNHSVDYTVKWENGTIGEYTCSLEDWARYELVIKLVEQGADEHLLDDLWSNGYSTGMDDGQDEGW